MYVVRAGARTATRRAGSPGCGSAGRSRWRRRSATAARRRGARAIDARSARRRRRGRSPRGAARCACAAPARRARDARGRHEREQPPLVARGAGEQRNVLARHPARSPATGASGKVTGSTTGANGRNTSRCSLVADLRAAPRAARRSGPGAGRPPRRARCRAPPAPARCTCGRVGERAGRLRGAALRDRAAGTGRARPASRAASPTDMPPADSPKIVTRSRVAAEGGDVVAHPAQRRDLIEHAGVVGGALDVEAGGTAGRESRARRAGS